MEANRERLPGKKIRVVVVDDSAVIRAVLKEILESDHRIEVVATAVDAHDAREKIKQYNPDVITLDIEMPKMDGITFLRNIMRLRPMPVVMVSTLTAAGAPITLEALEVGAVDFIAKPQAGQGNLTDYSATIIHKVLGASKANVRPIEEAKSKGDIHASRLLAPNVKRLRENYLCAMGASTGGTEAIMEVISALPAHSPPIVISQHIPEIFSTSFAQRLDSRSAIKVYEATEGQPIEAGCAYLAPGDDHLRVRKTARGYICMLEKSEKVNRHRPSVDVMFDSVVQAAGNNASGFLLTGMGADGAKGLLNMRMAGAITVAQDELTSVVWGMPGAAVRLDAACKVLPLHKIAQFILHDAFV
jgi:two-component system chemotaxis response regulator CheB